jgi:two-component system CheB/CheR fusion protein
MTPTSSIEPLLEHLKLTRGFDFTGYKRATLERRVAKRMEEVGIDDHLVYRDHLEVDPGEFAQLFNTILINVTSFFRDAPVWEHLATRTIPALLEALGDTGPIRVWCAGCSSGEEPYTIAMLLAEALGTAAYLERVKIYATDVDDEALAEARAAIYTDEQIKGVPAELLEKYFVHRDRHHTFRTDLRRTVIFGRNDLVQDAPISRIDLLSCRNTLMYFNAETQAQILRRLHFALSSNGVLLLGKSEMLITHSDLFVADDLKRRLFRPVRRRDERTGTAYLEASSALRPETGSAICDQAFDAAPVGQVVLDPAEHVIAINAEARRLFGLVAGDVGRPLRDLEVSYRPADLRSNLDVAAEDGHRVALGLVAHTTASGDRRTLDVSVTPVLRDGEVIGSSVAFADVTVQQKLRSALENSKEELENAYEELQSTVEELETTNEELQSTNEELETTNEELQSTNEELETMNEELQSTNEELETINDDLRERSTELNEINAFLETILTTMKTGVVVVDGKLVVRLWNGEAEELFGLGIGDVRGKALLELDVGLPVGELGEPLREVLRGESERAVVDLPATNRRGRPFEARVTVLPLSDDPAATFGAVLLVEELT